MIFDGKALAQQREEKVRQRVQTLLDQGVTPKIVSLTLDESPETAMYVELKRQAAERIGVVFEKVLLDSKSDEGVIREIREIGERGDIHGIWVQLPLPEQLDAVNVLSAIPPEKDIDCLNPINLGRLLFPKPTLIPATVRAVMTILETSKTDLVGKRGVVIGSSPWLGKPLALVLSQAGATVTMVWETESSLSDLTRQADVLITAVGCPHLITVDMVKEGAVVIDIGISQVAGKVVGDVDFDRVQNFASLISPVPGGVGPLTVVSLLENCLDLIQ